MRRRAQVEPSSAPLRVPAELLTCSVEAWVSPAEMVAEPMVRAWRRWRAARLAWAAEHGVDVAELPGGGAPRWSGRPWSD